ncbi:MAG: hypothetical protein D6B26_04500, partial [Spirochaetaceae bacterium]
RYLDPVYAQMSQLIASYEGPNDGVVSVSSAKWGEFGGVVNEIYDRTQVNHGDMVGDNELWNNMGFPFRRFFIDIALQLE